MTLTPEAIVDLDCLLNKEGKSPAAIISEASSRLRAIEPYTDSPWTLIRSVCIRAEHFIEDGNSAAVDRWKTSIATKATEIRERRRNAR